MLLAGEKTASDARRRGRTVPVSYLAGRIRLLRSHAADKRGPVLSRGDSLIERPISRSGVQGSAIIAAASKGLSPMGEKLNKEGN